MKLMTTLDELSRFRILMVIKNEKNTLEHRQVIGEWLDRIELLDFADWNIFKTLNVMMARKGHHTDDLC